LELQPITHAEKYAAVPDELLEAMGEMLDAFEDDTDPENWMR